MEWLDFRTQGGNAPVSIEDLRDFRPGGVRQPLKNPQLGIYKPRGHEAALSITTTYRPAGAERPYEDSVGPEGLMRYKWQGDDPEHANNRALRAAHRDRLPLIWFWGVAPGVYKPIYPVYLVAEEPEQQQFVVSTDQDSPDLDAAGTTGEILRRYLRQDTWKRLHQPVFRGLVLQAYRTQCAVCRLRHAKLLDAAHIVEDRAREGIAATWNGLSLCKIHHAAYDVGILGVSPDYSLAIREDILEEIDGPILEHGLKRLHGTSLQVIPRAVRDRPDRDRLARRFETFLHPGRPVPRIDIAELRGSS